MKDLNRRNFVKCLTCAACMLGVAKAGDYVFSGPAFAQEAGTSEILREVMFYKKLEDLKIECGVCPKKCRIADRERGYCGNKENRGGTYYSLVHSQPCTMHVDPIEKKPLFHYLPSSLAFSLATAGCNFECRFCQNWQIAQYRPEQIDSTRVMPEEIAKLAIAQNAPTIAYTYSEPVVFYEYMYDCAVEGKKHGVRSVMISNGFINEEPLVRLCSQLAACKIDLKAFSEKFYKEQCSGQLEPVLEALKILKKRGTWLEIVVLIIPTLNDNHDEIKKMSSWVSANLGHDVPLHFTRFHPMYKITNLPPTPVKTLEECHAIATAAGLHYVYLGNVPGHAAESTYCPRCKQAVIRRMGYSILENSIKNGACSSCGQPIPGIWKL